MILAANDDLDRKERGNSGWNKALPRCWVNGTRCSGKRKSARKNKAAADFIEMRRKMDLSFPQAVIIFPLILNFLLALLYYAIRIFRIRDSRSSVVGRSQQIWCLYLLVDHWNSKTTPEPLGGATILSLPRKRLRIRSVSRISRWWRFATSPRTNAPKTWCQSCKKYLQSNPESNRNPKIHPIPEIPNPGKEIKMVRNGVLKSWKTGCLN